MRRPASRDLGNGRVRKSERPRGLGWLRVMLAVTLVLPPLIMVGLAWQTRTAIWNATGRELQRSADALTEYTYRVLQSNRLLADLANMLVAQLDDAAITEREPALHAQLLALRDSQDQVNNISVFDRNGRLLVSTITLPVPRAASFADREWMALANPHAPPLHVSALARGRVDGTLFFAISRRRDAPGLRAGEFAGTISVSVDPRVVAQDLRKLSHDGADRLAIWREDGALLVRWPTVSDLPPPLAISAPMRAAMLQGREGASPPTRSSAAADGRDRLNVVRQVGSFPLFVAVGREAAVIDAAWYGRVRQQLSLVVPAWLGLAGLAMVALARARRAQAAQMAQAAAEQARATAEATARAEARFRGVFDSRVVGMLVFDMATGVVILANDRALEMVGQTRADFARNGLDWRGATPPEWLPLDEAALAQGRRQGWWETYEKEYRHADGRRLPVRISSAPLPDEPGHVVVMVEDITAQRQAEARRDTLMHEVEHRAKNMLSLVQAILRSSAGMVEGDAHRLADAVQGRIATLARAQSLLSQQHWQSAELATVVRGELAIFLDADNGQQQVHVSGPAVSLPAAAVQPLSMALHELATNAMKYGALSVPEGRLHLTWEVARESGDLRLVWLELGGPRITNVPSTTGFGSQLLRATLMAQLGGTITKDWPPEGLRCVITLPLAPASVADTIPATSQPVVAV